jgi:SAM-dependent methyltransferase
MTRWADIAGEDRASNFTNRCAQLAASGQDVHGEATFCTTLVPPGARVLDAGCGTGRVAIRLAELGYQCVGVDVDAAMLTEARRLAPGLEWVEADLAAYRAEEPFDLIVSAGNVIPLVARGTEAAVIANLAGALAENGVLVTGFGLDAAHLPLDAAPFGLAEFDVWCSDTGLHVDARYSTWSGEPYTGGRYAVSVLRRG